MTFDQWLASLALGRALTTDYPAIAEQGLVEGLESLSLASLAGTTVHECSPSELQEQLERGLREVKQSVPSREEAGRIMKRYYANQVACGALTPRVGAERIVKLAMVLRDVLPSREYVGDGLGVARLVGLFYAHDDVARNDHHAHAEIDAKLLEECRRLAVEPFGDT